ncbi:MAG: haloacid dehalogenase [Bacteroidetes bacterium]|nr:MAG: haloacid dehalogenase [Bacteroidota bacterium]
MRNIDSIIFDLGGVILNIDNKRTEREFVALGAKDFGLYFGHGHAASFFKDYEVGKISDEQFVSDLKKMINVDLTDELIINAWNALLMDFPPERIELLKSIREKYRLLLFSNTNSLHMEAVRKIFREAFGGQDLDDLFDKAYYSHILGMRKPDKEPFQLIARENGLDPSRTLFVDDALVNVNGAELAGLKGFYLPPGITIMDVRW